ncbi:MAG: NF038104 family lipoprotein [Pseudomonadota bacterium]
MHLKCRWKCMIFILIAPFTLQGCVGTLVGAVVDTTIEVVKIPFKVGKAAVDVVTGDDDKKKDD